MEKEMEKKSVWEEWSGGFNDDKEEKEERRKEDKLIHEGRPSSTAYTWISTHIHTHTLPAGRSGKINTQSLFSQ